MTHSVQALNPTGSTVLKMARCLAKWSFGWEGQFWKEMLSLGQQRMEEGIAAEFLRPHLGVLVSVVFNRRF